MDQYPFFNIDTRNTSKAAIFPFQFNQTVRTKEKVAVTTFIFPRYENSFKNGYSGRFSYIPYFILTSILIYHHFPTNQNKIFRNPTVAPESPLSSEKTSEGLVSTIRLIISSTLTMKFPVTLFTYGQKVTEIISLLVSFHSFIVKEAIYMVYIFCWGNPTFFKADFTKWLLLQLCFPQLFPFRTLVYLLSGFPVNPSGRILLRLLQVWHRLVRYTQLIKGITEIQYPSFIFVSFQLLQQCFYIR